MYHQFKQLADVDITKEPMEIAPTMHYTMGGIRVDADSTAATVPGLFAAGECAGGMHGSNRLGGNSLSDLIVFGRRAGMGAADYALNLDRTPTLDFTQVEEYSAEMLGYFDGEGDENPYSLQAELQDTMHRLVGIIRVESELQEAVERIEQLKERSTRIKVVGGRRYNPGWHLAIDMKAMLTVSECIAKAALSRRESRGGHTRDDYPGFNEEFGKVNTVERQSNGYVDVFHDPLPQMPVELAELFEDSH
jgi:succinate dehydrogenase / fumarate reductase flavoprotein subunit